MRFVERLTPRRVIYPKSPRGFRPREAGTGILGGICILAGVLTLLVGMRVIPGRVSVPYSVITIFGTAITGLGMVLAIIRLGQYRTEVRRARAAKRHPGNSAYADYPWQRSDFKSHHWSSFIRAVGIAGFLTLFLAPFNYLVLFELGPENLPFALAVIIFDPIVLLFWIHALYLLGQALKFGTSRVVVGEIPIPLRETVTVPWEPAAGIGLVDRGSFSLRCFREQYSKVGRRTNLEHDELWCGTWELMTLHHFNDVHTRSVELTFRLPDGALPTRLSDDVTIFWELEVKLERQGFDFLETYLVPIY